ncbi:MAG: hypothetical protein OCD00_16830 [Colwellia sp.]
MVKIAGYLLILLLSVSAIAMPKILVKHKRTLDNFAQIQVINETAEKLICYVAINGKKIKFRLNARQYSKWYKATDTRFNYKHFSTWCDYLSLHPKYK